MRGIARGMRFRLATMLFAGGCAAGDGTTPTDKDTADNSADTAEDTPLQTRLGICDAFDVDTIEGVDSLAGADAELDEIHDLGLGIVRAHRPGGGVFSMSLVHPPEATTDDWTLPDTLVASMNVSETPLIATAYSYTDVGPFKGQVMVGYVVPEGMTDWLAFVGRMVERYDGDGVDDMPGLTMPIAAWEIGNEPMCPPEDDVCPAAYIAFEKPTYDAMKAASPDTTVMIAGAAPAFNADGALDAGATSIYSAFFSDDGGTYTDVLSFHVAVGVAEPPVTTYLDWWKATAPDTPLWIGESGTRSPEDRFVISDDPEIEAAWYQGFLDDAYGGGAERVLWCRAGHAIDAVPEVWSVIHDYAADLSET